MTTTLQITLTEEELTTVFGWLDTLRPGLTGPEKISLLQAHARHLLHMDLLDRLAVARTADVLDAENEQRRAERDAVDSVDVFVATAETTPPGE